VITPHEITLKAERQYMPFLQSWLRGEPFIPIVFPVGKRSSDFVGLQKEVERLQAQEKMARGYGYRIQSETQQKRALGTQTVPVRIVLETPQDLLVLIEKEQEFILFEQDVKTIREQFPQLEIWLQSSPKKIIDQHGSWPGLLAVCQYFLDHPQPQHYIRELAINVDTKFIERHAGILRELLEHILPQEAIVQNAITFQQRFGLREEEIKVHMRFLDDQLSKHYGLAINELSIPHSQCAALPLAGQQCVITENKMTFLTLPPLPDTFAIFGAGFRVGSLSTISWLYECPIIYWGDLDAQGFQILSQLRSIFPHVVSLMMDKETLDTFIHFGVPGTPTIVRHLPHLTPQEHELFLHLAQNNIRLEQERIHHAYALQHIHAIQG
jgi:hypothetical protein